MARILLVGIAALDIINIVEHYPGEDEEMRATAQRRCRGGNASNTSSVLSQLGHQCSWMGTLADDNEGRWLLQDMQAFGIDTTFAVIKEKSTTPTSYICLNKINGSRTIVHYRELDELHNSDIQVDEISAFDWLHFEGRNVSQVTQLIEKLSQHCPKATVSIEIEKDRENIEALFDKADLLMFSRHFVTQRGLAEAGDVFRFARMHGARGLLTCTWGSDGAYYSTMDDETQFVAAEKITNVVDTVGAGDAFNGGLIDALVDKQSLSHSVAQGNRIAGIKIQQPGFNDLAF